MIREDTSLQGFDSISGNFGVMSVADLFGKVIGSGVYTTSTNEGGKETDIISVALSSFQPYYVSDWKGYCLLTNIERINGVADWITIGTTNGKFISVTPDTLFPIYDPSRAERGFHGETKYHMTPTRADELSIGDTLRVRNCYLDDTLFTDFDTVKIIERKAESSRGYTLVTNSGFYNGNDIYMISDPEKYNSETSSDQ